MTHSDNIYRIKIIAETLQQLPEKVVFVGGSILSLYADRQIFEVRPTYDIDVIVALVKYSERIQYEEKIRNLGFQHDIDSGIVCRFKLHDIIVDIMPTNDETIGFNNKWYEAGFTNSIAYETKLGFTFNILDAPFFLATKFEAFNQRGQGDGRTSHDFEDIIFILENRSTIWNELNSCNPELKSYFIHQFENLLRNRYHFEWIDANVERSTNPSTLKIISNIKAFIQ